MDEDKLEQIIRRLESVEQRVATLEGRPQPVAGPPPFVVPPPRFETAAMAPSPLQPIPRRASPDAELAIGTKALPWAGAGIVVLGLVYGAKWAVDQGWVTPAMQFAGLALVSLLFVGVGLWRDRLGEWLGQLLAGIGVAGLLLTSVAGTTTFDLYEGNVAVGLTVFVNLASVAFGAVRGSRGFAALGMAGGVLCSWLPASDRSYAACLFLHALVVISTASVAGYRRWSNLALGTWIVGVLTYVPMLYFGEQDVAWQARVGVMYLESVALAAAYAMGCDRKFDPAVVFPAVAALVVGCLGMVAEPGLSGSSHTLLLAAALGGLAMFPSLEKPSRIGLAVAGLLVALVVSPFGLQQGERALAFTLLSLACGSAAIAFKSRIAAAFAWIELFVAGGVYLRIVTGFVPSELRAASGLAVADPLQLVLMLAACAVGAVASGRLLDREGEESQTGSGAVNVLATLIGWAIVGRLGRLLLTSDAVGMAYDAALTVSWATYALALIPLGFWVRRKSVRYSAFAILAMTIGKILVVDLSEVDLAIRILILIVLGTTMLAVSYFAYLRPRAANR